MKPKALMAAWAARFGHNNFLVGSMIAALLAVLAVGGWYLGSGGVRTPAPSPPMEAEPMASNGNEWIAPEAPKPRPDGWITLFDGKRLYGCASVAANIESGNVRLEDGRLYLEATNIQFDVRGRDVIVRVRLKKVSGQNCTLFVRKAGNGNDTGGWFNGGNSFGVGHHVGGPWSDLANVRAGRRYDDFFEMEFRAEGSHLTLKADGQVICEGEDASMLEGTVGILALKGLTVIESIEARVLDVP
jgi:hypothetical protein